MDFENNQAQSSPNVSSAGIWKKWIGTALIIVLAFGFGYKSGQKGFIYEPKEFKVVNVQDAPKDVNYQLLWDAIKVVNEKYIEKKPTAEQYLYGAVRGAVASTGDPYTTFFEPKDLEVFKTDLKGSFDGIGAEIGKINGNIVVIAPLDDSPSKKAGILAKDIILKVDGQPTAEWSTDEAVNHIRGKKGTKVVLNIFREGRTQPFDVEIFRDKIVINSVKYEIKEKDGKKIAYIKVNRFGDDTKALFEKAVNDLLTKSVTGVIIDLRNDPGGYLQTAVDLASHWVKSGDLVVKEARSQAGDIVYNASGLNRLSGIKTIVMINGGSASASEILAGALQDHKKATLLGEKSFGKGSVQELVDLPEGGAVKVTVAKWITPGGKNLNKDGLKPDIEVKLTEDDIKNLKDPQMDKALEEIVK